MNSTELDKEAAAASLRAWSKTATGPYLRPFRPNPEWRTARVFIVGTNPATPMRDEFNSFDDYWHALTCDPLAFEEEYAKLTSSRSTKTSRRVKVLLNTLGGLNCLVTNACAYPAARESDVPSEAWKRGRDVFAALLRICEPRVIFAHGARARRLIRDVYGVDTDPLVPPDQQATIVGGTLLLFAPHLSGAGLPKGASFNVNTALPEFGARIRAHLG